MDINTAWQTWGASGLKDTTCLSACYLQSSAALAMASALHNLSSISALRDDAKHAGTNSRKLRITESSGW